jgi:hypothetical protein
MYFVPYFAVFFHLHLLIQVGASFCVGLSGTLGSAVPALLGVTL